MVRPDPSSQTSNTPLTEQERAEFIRARCTELVKLADGPRFRLLRYLLDMARLEAEDLAKRLST